MKKNIFIVISLFITVVLVIAIGFTVIKLGQKEPVAPTAPKSKPKAEAIPTHAADCELAFNVGGVTGTPTPTGTLTVTPTESLTPTPTEEITPTPTETEEELTPTPTTPPGEEPTPTEIAEGPTLPPEAIPTTFEVEVPPAGILENTVLAVGAGVMLLLAGLLLVL